MFYKHVKAGIVAASIVAAVGCVAATGRAYVRVGPPLAINERVQVAPGPGVVWQAGYYRWDGREYRWVPGRYEQAPRPRAEWIQGRWVHDSRGWYFIEGHWR